MSRILSLTALGLASVAAVMAQSELDFQPCPTLNNQISRMMNGSISEFDCATLSVPLDYTDTSSGNLDLSLFRVNATAEPVLGSVLMNFGGPGGTGAENLPAFAELAHAVIGPQWNLISWDPRGTGFTIPFICDLENIATIPEKKRQLGTLVSTNLTRVFLNGGWELAGELAEYCASGANETAELIGTAFTARDMMEIVDALGEDGLLRYYGISYGTALGSYAAAMFPERIERMVLDANVNPHDYQAGHYGRFANDIDAAFAGFLQACFDAADDCALYSLLQPNSTQDLLDVINLVIGPFAISAGSSIEGYLEYLGIKGIFIQPLYAPSSWPGFAQLLASAFNGTLDAPSNEPAPVPYGEAVNAVIGIRASDATFIANTSAQYLPQVQFQANVSRGFSDVSYFTLWASAQWTIPAKERYWGDFQANTKTPILYINGEYDPVTPLINAYNGSAGFNGSVVLPHGGYGHGIFADPSSCVAEYVQAYFLNASLPDEDTRCEPDVSLVQMWTATVQGREVNFTDSLTGSETDNSGSGSGSGSGSNGQENSASQGTPRSVYGLVAGLAITAVALL
ncbi:hypothetical protein PV10_05925 [Exophiala mesophila]|uniref:Uncharacterized protein n=1 Tax=Exophiala mesophila TaxID=212818 RepID=A0A0D1XTA6_EXOME|nr:uncharacterized protein PV10_05925 [Exophiala mesophila]KIV91381.1 hypothetical protein PV10_05925 [Exophiala mesophila]